MGGKNVLKLHNSMNMLKHIIIYFKWMNCMEFIRLFFVFLNRNVSILD